jgi:hypothetical protein
MAGWNEDRRRLDAEAGAAREAFRAALLADPTWSAYRQQVLTQHRLRTRWLEASGTSARLGRGEFQPAPPIDELSFDMLTRIVAQSAEQEGTAEVAAGEAAREDVGQAAADEAGRA